MVISSGFILYDPLGRRVMQWHSSHQQQKTHYLWFGDQLVGIRDELNEDHTHTRYWHYDGWDLLAQQFIESYNRPYAEASCSVLCFLRLSTRKH